MQALCDNRVFGEGVFQELWCSISEWENCLKSRLILSKNTLSKIDASYNTGYPQLSVVDFPKCGIVERSRYNIQEMSDSKRSWDIGPFFQWRHA